jgi:exocyst complex component 1
MHKSKENTNGTFSIGKTWNLDELTHIESFTGPTVNPTQRDWAGETGFVVTIGKPYFWQAQTDKEKKFFIASLTKIYGKYTNGRTPQMLGFDQRELDQVLGTTTRRPVGAAGRPPPQELMGNQSQSNLSVSSAPGTPGAPYQQGSPSRPPPRANGNSSPVGSVDSSRSQNQQALRRLAGSNRSQDSVANSMTARSDDGSTSLPRSRNGMNGSGSYGRFGDPAEPVPVPSPAPPQEERPPERKRPPMDPSRPQGINDRDLVPAPLMSPGMRRDPIVPPRSMDRVIPRKDSGDQKPDARSDTSSLRAQSTTPVTDASKTEPPNTMKSPSNGSIAAPSTTTVPLDGTPTESPVETEGARPGLGPMIKSKKSKGDIAGAFWKAANTATTFKPRPGGAGERLRLAQIKAAEGPDGITGVVPAPPRPPPVTAAVKEAPVEPPRPLLEQIPALPEVKVTMPGSTRPASLDSSVKEAIKNEEPAPKDDDPRRSIIIGNDAKYLATLGLDPSILDNRSTEFTKWLDYFGWVPGDQMRSKAFDEIKIDTERELNKAQAGGWLARFREEDERVEAIKQGIDLAMTECEELDNLLTLYSVELSVCSRDT